MGIPADLYAKGYVFKHIATPVFTSVRVMAGRLSKIIADGDRTSIEYDQFIKECKRLKHANGGVRSYLHKDRKMTVYGDIQGQVVETEVYMGIFEFEVSMKIGPYLADIVGPFNYNFLRNLVEDPDAQIARVELHSSQQFLRNLDVDALCVGDIVPPYIVCRCSDFRNLRQFFMAFYGVPLAYEVPAPTALFEETMFDA